MKAPTKLTLTLAADAKVVRASFLRWHRILTSVSERADTFMRIAGTDVCFRRIARHTDKVHLDFWVGASTRAAVQLNQPGVAGSEHPGTTVAVDARGRTYLVRQGDLHGNPPSARISGEEFSRRTGLKPVDMLRGDVPARKRWHVVARLDGRSDAAIRSDTAEFVRRCWNARVYGTRAAADHKRLTGLFGSPERGGWWDVDPALEPRRVLAVQGYVSECLAELLEAEGMKLEKPRHAANYEVDGTVDVPGSPVLIEIKTGVSPADVYAGVGQLTVYPILLPDLAKHRRILLLPGRPGPRLVKALEGCGVELHSYELKRRRRSASARFGAALLRRCGVQADRVADLVASGEALP